MKIGILTFHRALNYGAVWQCWALVQMCRKLGHQTQVIDYSPVGIWRYRYYLKYRIDKGVLAMKRLYNFNLFYKKLPKTINYGENHNAILHNPPSLDVYLVGSDQMWSKQMVGEHILSFALDFAPTTVKRISYAVSQGGEFCQDQEFINELKKFSAISLREPTWAAKLSKLTGKLVSDTCDPVLLLDANEYIHKEKKVLFLPKKYIAVFDMNNEPLIRECAERLKQKLGLPLISIGGSYKKWCDKSLFGISPEQWIYVMHHSSFVCTNGFHGTAFSIVLRKPFITVSSVGKVTAIKDDRKRNILKQCGLQTQFVADVKQVENAILCDFANAEPLIKIYRDRSIEWLKEVLG